MLLNLFALLWILLCFVFSLSVAYLDFPRRICKVFLGRDVVAVKDVPRLVAGDFPPQEACDPETKKSD